MGLGKKYATDLLSGMKEDDVGNMMRLALQGHAQSRNMAPVAVPGGPRNASPIVRRGPTPVPGPGPGPTPTAPMPTPIGGGAGMRPSLLRSFVPQQQAGSGAAAAQTRPNINLRSFVPRAPISSPSAPIEGGATPYTQVVGAPPGWKPSDAGLAKPRVRVRAAGRRIPAAPIGSPAEAPEAPTERAQTPSNAPKAPSSAPMPRIRSEEEWQRLPSGSDFIWVPNGKQYTKE
jgi:hypothetical protein